MTTPRDDPRPLDVRAVRAQFPALSARVGGKRLVYLDNACTALKSRRVAERLRDFYSRWGACGGRRSTHLLSQQVENWFQQTRRQVARFINARGPEEIVFTSGATEAVNLVARAFACAGRRREVVLTDLEHNSVVLPFLEAARSGKFVLRLCPTRDGRLDEEALGRLVTDKTALVAMTHASNVMGGVLPAGRAARLAHSRGAQILVDDAQFLSSHREDVQALDADFAVFSAHKLGGPFGVGVLYGKEQRLNGLGVYKTGGGTVRNVVWTKRGPRADYLDAPARFEAGIPNFGGVTAFSEALALLESWPQPAVRAAVSALVRRAAAGLARRAEVKVLGRPEDLAEGSLVSFAARHPRFSLQDFGLFLNHELRGRFIAVRIGEHCAHLLNDRLRVPGTVRLSFFAYNTAREIDFFLDALDAYLRELRR
ncbi:MAG: aminotransferase class V-fold PLP-dependent enzyme [Elusimicrobia bacterium]|nr:aminotransferase class V-fold PLP-dependent enzyme [Elusimicrobiota bacterium]